MEVDLAAVVVGAVEEGADDVAEGAVEVGLVEEGSAEGVAAVYVEVAECAVGVGDDVAFGVGCAECVVEGVQ